MNRRTFVAVLVGSTLAVVGGAGAQNAAPRGPGQGRGWGMQAENEFRLGPGMGPRLMTEEEWSEHREKMRTLPPAERDAYRREMHAKMRERAKERGIDMPATPGGGPPPGRGPAK